MLSETREAFRISEMPPESNNESLGEDGGIMNNREKTRISRGDIYYADLNPVVGSEQGGVRPVLVVQNDVGNLHSPTVIVAAITTRDLKTEIPTHISIEGLTNGLKRESMVLLEQIRTIDRTRLQEYIGHLGIRSMNHVNNALAISLGLHFIKRERKSLMNEGKRCWIYCRTNKMEECKAQLELQEKKLREYAKQSGITVVGVSTDVCSGLVLKRFGLDVALEAAKEKEMDMLLVLSVAHLGRDVVTTLEYMSKLLGYGVGIETLNEGRIDFVPYLKYPLLNHSQQ